MKPTVYSLEKFFLKLRNFKNAWNKLLILEISFPIVIVFVSLCLYLSFLFVLFFATPKTRAIKIKPRGRRAWNFRIEETLYTHIPRQAFAANFLTLSLTNMRRAGGASLSPDNQQLRLDRAIPCAPPPRSPQSFSREGEREKERESNRRPWLMRQWNLVSRERPWGHRWGKKRSRTKSIATGERGGKVCVWFGEHRITRILLRN